MKQQPDSSPDNVGKKRPGVVYGTAVFGVLALFGLFFWSGQGRQLLTGAGTAVPTPIALATEPPAVTPSPQVLATDSPPPPTLTPVPTGAPSATPTNTVTSTHTPVPTATQTATSLPPTEPPPGQ